MIGYEKHSTVRFLLFLLTVKFRKTNSFKFFERNQFCNHLNCTITNKQRSIIENPYLKK